MVITLAGCAIVKDGKILLLNRIKTGWYELPGGKVDEGESAPDAAIRELKEELQVDVEIIRPLGTKHFREDDKHYVYLWFLAKILNEQKPTMGEPDKFDHCKYISLDELANHTLSPNMANFLNEMTKGNIKI